MVDGEHYFSAHPTGAAELRSIDVPLLGRSYRLTTAGGMFSPGHLDTGTAVLLANVPEPPPSGHLLDLGCGWGPVALTLALQSPLSTVWAVDVNTRALEMTARNAADLGLTNINVALPEDVPADVQFAALWSNPPIRIGKSELHALLSEWMPRLEPGSDSWLVVQRNLGSDSLQRWMDGEFTDFAVSREALSKGFRVLRARRHEVEGA